MSASLRIPFETVMSNMPQFVMAFGLVLFGKMVYDATTPYRIDDELTGKNNAAFGVCLAGYLIGLGLALCGALFGAGESLLDDLVTIFIGGIAAVVLLRLSVWVNDKFILHRFSIDKEMIEDGNVGTGAVVAGSCIATGLMLNGVLTGESTSLVVGLRDIVVYWIAGQLLLILGARVFQLITSYDVHKVIGEDDNLPAGLSFGGFLVGLGIIVRAALLGATSQLLDELLMVAVVGVLGLVLLTCARVIADKALLPNALLSKEIVEDKNVAAGAVAAAGFICVALVLATAITLGN